MKVIQIPRRFVQSDWGGTETVILETSKQLQQLGHDTSIFTSMALAKNHDELIDGIPVRRFNYCYPWWGLTDDARLQMDRKGGNLVSLPLMNALRKEPNLDIIHLHTFKRLGGSARVVAKQRKIPYVVTLHGGLFDVPDEEFASVVSPFKGSFEWGKPLGVMLGSRQVVPDADAVICVGMTECEQVRKRYPGLRVEHVPNGVDVARFAKGDRTDFRAIHGIPEHAQLVLVMGRIDHQKNQLGAVQALVEIRKQLPDVYLLLIGHVTNTPYMEKVVQTAQQLGVADRVVLIPGIDAHSPDLVNAYHAADMFLLPSIHEPFGIVILEAWAAGLPVAASRVGGVPSFVKHEYDALLFDPSDISAMAQSVCDVLMHPAISQGLAEKGLLKAQQQYSWEIITRRMVSIYDEVRAAHRKGDRH
ncbi:MAG: glycosyltransferase family 4 protein [Armatimonadota bacterium]